MKPSIRSNSGSFRTLRTTATALFIVALSACSGRGPSILGGNGGSGGTCPLGQNCNQLDPYTVEFESATYNRTENGSIQISFNATSQSSATQAGSFDLILSEVAQGNSVTLPPSAGAVDFTSRTIQVLVNSNTVQNGKVTVNLSMIDDSIYEASESVNLSIGNISGVVLGNLGSAQMVIADDEPRPMITVRNASSQLVGDEGLEVILTVDKQGQSKFEDTIDLSANFNSSASSSDINIINNSQTLLGSQLSAQFRVLLVQDSVSEGNEFLDLEISSNSNNIQIDSSADSRTLRIEENSSSLPKVYVGQSNLVREERTQAATLTIGSTGTSTNDIDVLLQINHNTSSPADIQVNPSVTANNRIEITIPAGQNSASYTLQALEDNYHEMTEDLDIQIISVSSNASIEQTLKQTDVSITDNRLPKLSFEQQSVLLTEGEQRTFKVKADIRTFQQISGVISPKAVAYQSPTATPQVDYAFNSPSFTIQAGLLRSGTITFDALMDNEIETTEYATLQFSSVNAATAASRAQDGEFDADIGDVPPVTLSSCSLDRSNISIPVNGSEQTISITCAMTGPVVDPIQLNVNQINTPSAPPLPIPGIGLAAGANSGTTTATIPRENPNRSSRTHNFEYEVSDQNGNTTTFTFSVTWQTISGTDPTYTTTNPTRIHTNSDPNRGLIKANPSIVPLSPAQALPNSFTHENLSNGESLNR